MTSKRRQEINFYVSFANWYWKKPFEHKISKWTQVVIYPTENRDSKVFSFNRRRKNIWKVEEHDFCKDRMQGNCYPLKKIFYQFSFYNFFSILLLQEIHMIENWLSFLDVIWWLALAFVEFLVGIVPRFPISLFGCCMLIKNIKNREKSFQLYLKHNLLNWDIQILISSGYNWEK